MSLPIRFSIPAVLILLVLVSLAVFGFAEAPANWKEPIRFGGTLLAGTVAVYALMLNLNNNRLSAAAKLMERYNDPKCTSLKESIRATINAARAGGTITVEHNQIGEILNFFEEMGVLVKFGLGHEPMLKAFFQTTVIECNKALQPWLDQARITKNQYTACKHFEDLAKRWSR